MSNSQLRVLAVSAPHWPLRPSVSVRSFGATTPFSLQNAVRMAAGQAMREEGSWADSNWRTFEDRRNSVLLLEFMDEAQYIFRQKLKEINPNLLLIGAMTLAFPGAIRLAQIAREELGDGCLIVLGGKHCNETLAIQNRARISPLRLMETGEIPRCGGRPLFDLIVSGEGEDVISRLGELVHEAAGSDGEVCANVCANFTKLKSCSGSWTVGWLTGEGPTLISQKNSPLTMELIPTAPSLFGLQSRFPVFDSVLTGHAYSDMGLGCRFNCHFCSERSSINGKHRTSGAAARLLRHLDDIWAAGKELGGDPIAAFVEDSIILRGDPLIVDEFIELRRQNLQLPMKVGCQMTVNDIKILHEKGLLKKLAEVGIDYVAFGMETVNEEAASKMSKHRGRGLWIEKNRVALEYLHKANLRAGVYIMWGLGERRWERVKQLEQLGLWQKEYGGQPCAIGLNWETIHPSMSDIAENEFPTFLEWGIDPNSPRLSLFVELLGEGSERYALKKNDFPTTPEWNELRQLYDELLPARQPAKSAQFDSAHTSTNAEVETSI